MENYKNLIKNVNNLIKTISFFIASVLLFLITLLYITANTDHPRLFVSSLYSKDCYEIGEEPAMKLEIYFTELESCKKFLKLRDE